MTAIALTHREEIIERLAKGEYLKDIASDLGVSSGAISRVLHSDPEYMEAREQGMAEKLDNAHSLLAEITESREIRKEEAGELLNLARIREIGIRRLEWRAEREFSSRWGSKVEHKQDLSLSITVNRSLPDVTVIQGDYVAITDELRNDPLKPA
jgi:transcriptional regulator with XRE-family HTH domain